MRIRNDLDCTAASQASGLLVGRTRLTLNLSLVFVICGLPAHLSAATWQSSNAQVPLVDAARNAPEAGPVVNLQRLTGPITFDGLPDEAAWAAIQPLALTMYEPTYRGESGRRIELRAAYDDEAIYLSARFQHDNPDDVRAFSLTRDRWSGDDSFGVLLDTFNDNENAVRFVGMPLGNRMDMSISGGGVGERDSGGPRGTSWNAFWDYETVMLEDGWAGEMRIPFSELRFEAGPDGSAVMGMMAYVYEPGSESRWTFPAIPRSASYTQISAWQDVRIRDVVPQSPTYVTPYVVMGASRSSALQEGPPAAWNTQKDESAEIGLDVKFSPTPNLTLDLTVNTDFAAVEADQQQVNLTRFSLFFDEKRPFFQERAGIFSFGTGAERGTLFYSRRIGLQSGSPVPILGGARLVGRIGAWDLGLIEMQTEGAAGVPGENFGVLRLRRQMVNEHSYLGAMTTSRIDTDGLYNVTWGIDAQLRPFGDEYLTLKVLQTVQGGDDTRDAVPNGTDAGRIMAEWTRRRVEGLSYTNVFVWSGAGYNPGMGFESRTDFKRAQSDWNYQWYPEAGSRWRRVWLGLKSRAWIRNADSEVETANFQPFLQLETADGMTFKGEVTTTIEDVVTQFQLATDAFVPADRYVATEAALEFRSPRGWNVRPNLTVTAGQFFDGRRVAINSSFNWAPSMHVEFVGGMEFNRIRFDDRNQEFDANLIRLTTRLAANTRASLDIFGQYNSLTDQLTTNTRFRYNFREGQDLWFVWNEGLNLDRDVLDVPRLPLSDARTLTVKYTHTLVF